MRRQSLSFLFCILVGILFIQEEHVFSQEKLALTHGPYLIDPGENAITIVWFTNKKCVSWVEYCGDDNFGIFPTWGGYPKIAQNSHHGLIDANNNKHAIRISNLKLGTKYRYRIVSKEILQFDPYEVLYGDSVVGEVLEFETLNPGKANFAFGVATDVHERAAKLDTLLQTTAMDSLDMMFFTGDILNWTENETRIFNGFLDEIVKHFARKKPYIYVRGNHETRGRFARNLMSYFPHSSGNFYYSFNHGNVHFIVLDSGEDKPDTHPVYAGLVDFDKYREEQAEWLRKEVQSDNYKNALYKIALFHIPLFAGKKWHGPLDLTKKWGHILNDAKIDLVINGHHHRYSRIKPTAGKNNFPIVVIGQDQILKTEVSTKQLALTIKNKDGGIVEKFSIPAKVLQTSSKNTQ